LDFKSATLEIASKLGLWKRTSQITADPLASFFYMCLCRQNIMPREESKSPGVYFEFGVGWGGSLTTYITALKHFCQRYGKDLYAYHIFGFDSFRGLPQKMDPRDDNPAWQKGSFAHSVLEVENRVKCQGLDTSRGTLHWVEGYFEQTLTPNLKYGLKGFSPSIVTIDVDYYSSTRSVLNWLRPMLHDGTIFYFDDIWAFHGNPKYGELAAINEFNQHANGQLVQFPLLGMPSRAFIYYSDKSRLENDLQET